MYPTSDGFSLWGETGIRPGDVDQGQIGDCWFISAASALAEDYERLERVFLNTEASTSVGIYALNFYALGVPITITIDDLVPVID